MDDDVMGRCRTNSQIKFKIIMLISTLCHYSDGYILVKRSIIIKEAGADAAAKNADARNKELIRSGLDLMPM